MYTVFKRKKINCKVESCHHFGVRSRSDLMGPQNIPLRFPFPSFGCIVGRWQCCSTNWISCISSWPASKNVKSYITATVISSSSIPIRVVLVYIFIKLLVQWNDSCRSRIFSIDCISYLFFHNPGLLELHPGPFFISVVDLLICYSLYCYLRRGVSVEIKLYLSVCCAFLWRNMDY